MTQLSYACGSRAVPLLAETIGANLRRTSASFPDHPALICDSQGYRATYRELWAQTGELARALLALGVRRGDRVGIWAPNRYEWVLLQYATARVGAILVTINPAYRTSELAYACNQSAISVLFLAAGFRQSDYMAMLAEVRPQCPALRQEVVLERDFGALLRRAAEIPADELAAHESALQPGEAINIQYTSGTTGFPKGAMLSHTSLLNNGFFVGETLGYSAADRICVPVPFYHCFGMVMGNLAATSHGACIVVPGEAFEPRAVLRTVSRERCTSLYGVPTMFIAVLDALQQPPEQPGQPDAIDLSSLRTGIMAGSPCPIEVMKRVRTDLHMPEVSICYGMTETAPVSTQTALDDPLERRVGTVGRVHPHVEIKVVDPATSATVPRGVAGELCTRGYSVMLGYYQNPTATAQAIDPEGWMHTGDLATLDEQGYVNIVGRIKDMIIRGGENIYPREVEEFLHTHPALSDAQVIGVPSPRYGEEVMAWVKLRAGASVTADELQQFCKSRIATYKIPRYWKFVDSFPMTVTGKIQKFRMRELAIAELGLDAAARIQTA